MEDLPKWKSKRLKSWDYRETGYYYVTFCTARRKEDILCSLQTVGGGLCAAPLGLELPLSHVELTPIGEIVNRSILDIPKCNPGVEVDVYCIMPDHIHLVLVLTGRHRGRPLPAIIGRLKSYTQNQYLKLGSIWGPHLWQQEYYDHIIRDPDDLANTRRYIQGNPITTKEELL